MPTTLRLVLAVAIRAGLLVLLMQATVSGWLDGFLKAVGLYSDDALGAGIVGFLLIAVAAAVLGLVDGAAGLPRVRTRLEDALPFALWVGVAVVVGVGASVRAGPEDLLVVGVLAGVVITGALPGALVGHGLARIRK